MTNMKVKMEMRCVICFIVCNVICHNINDLTYLAWLVHNVRMRVRGCPWPVYSHCGIRIEPGNR